MSESGEVERPEDALIPVYVAGSVKEATKVEKALAVGDVEYSLRHQKYTTFLFGDYDGVAFDVLETDRDHAVELLRRAGLKKGLIS